jgi:D-alanyl-D-alanine carboxypeptidase
MRSLLAGLVCTATLMTAGMVCAHEDAMLQETLLVSPPALAPLTPPTPWVSPARPTLEAPALRSSFAVVRDDTTGEILMSKNGTTSVPIASISKLMTALVTLDASLDLSELIEIDPSDVRATAPNRSALAPGMSLSRDDVLHVALMASDNRAAVALGRTYPGGMTAFVAAMNAKAIALGMTGSHFAEPSGLSRENVSTAEDLARLISAANTHALIGRYSTDRSHTVTLRGRPVTFRSTNALVRAGETDIAVQKTGFTRPAGQCLVMMLNGTARKFTVVLLDAMGRYDPVLDAAALRHWLEPGYVLPASLARLGAPTRPVQKASHQRRPASTPRVRDRQHMAAAPVQEARGIN